MRSQKGKGGVGYILQENYGLNLPAKFKEAMGYAAKGVSDKLHKELKADEVYQIFTDQFVNNRKVFEVPECHFKQIGEGIEASVTVEAKGSKAVVGAEGNGRLDAVTNALKKYFDVQFTLTTYEQHSIGEKSDAQALSYVGIEKAGKSYWGAGINEDIIRSSIEALVSALNNYFESVE